MSSCFGLGMILPRIHDLSIELVEWEQLKEKAPALSGRGSAVSAGGGRGCRSPRGGEGRTSTPPTGSEKKCVAAGSRYPDKRNAPECVPRRFADSCLCRRLSPVPDSTPTPKRRFGKALTTAIVQTRRPLPGAYQRHRSRYIFGLDSGSDPRQSCVWARKVGVSRSLIPLSAGGVQSRC